MKVRNHISNRFNSGIEKVKPTKGTNSFNYTGVLNELCVKELEATVGKFLRFFVFHCSLVTLSLN